MRKLIFAGNWKMHKTLRETEEYFKEFKKNISKMDLNNREIIIAPPFTALFVAKELVKDTSIKLSAQNVGWEEEGAFTGEISPLMLKELNVSYVIVGHSERRRIFKENNELISKRVSGAYKFGLTPILCVGETLEERKAGKTLKIVEEQLVEGLKGLKNISGEDIVIAYEPVWAIGTGVNATPEQAQEVHIFIRNKLTQIYSKDIADKIRILYGGSVNPDNIFDLINQPDIDGVLVGGASLNPEKFAKICAVEIKK